MQGNYHIAIIGSGPAGLSAAARAAQRAREANEDIVASHILLESSDLPAKTIQRYQKGKFVMAEPGFLNLRSDCGFAAGSREQILERWQQDIERNNINIRYRAAVESISGTQGEFKIKLANGEELQANYVILAIGLQGNPRKLEIPGAADSVDYTLDDPDDFHDKDIIIVGAGDAAIENALALSENNRVTLLNRRAEFSRAKEGNLNGILRAVNNPKVSLQCLYEASPQTITIAEKTRYTMTVALPEGTKEVPADHIIARLGAFPPRAFVESIGIAFPSDAPDATPTLTAKYESSVPGIYVIGALAGYPLIKQAMNQGYDVVEYIHGNPIKPVDNELLECQFGLLPFQRDADILLDIFQQRIPMFRQLNALVFRQLVIESKIWVAFAGIAYEQGLSKLRTLQEYAERQGITDSVGNLLPVGSTIYEPGDYTSTFFIIVEGQVKIEQENEEGAPTHYTLERGEFFGIAGLISGRPRNDKAIIGDDCILIEVPRRFMLKLINSNEVVRQGINLIFTIRTLQKHFAKNSPPMALREIAQRAVLKTYRAGEIIFKEGEPGDCMHIISRGAVAVQRNLNSKPVTVAQLQTDQLLGEMVLMGASVRRDSAIATVLTETIMIDQPTFLELVRFDASCIEQLQKNSSKNTLTYTKMQSRADQGSILGFLLDQGLGEATDALIIDEGLCIGCDNCEKACAETHNGIARLQRAAGKTEANMHVPIACRHCEIPHCMKDCPPDAIHRAKSGEVFIDDSCIGCGNCVSNCPYDAIKLAYDAPKKPSLLTWLLFGLGDGPGEHAYAPNAESKKKGQKAVKCDACMNLASGPACVNACPTGAAIRLAPESFVNLGRPENA